MADSLSLLGIHILQRIRGCEWDNDTGDVNAFYQFGYDGEDFIALDLKTMMCVAANPQAVTTKHLWDRDKFFFKKGKTFDNKDCPERLKKFLKYLENFLQKAGTIISSLLIFLPFSSV